MEASKGRRRIRRRKQRRRNWWLGYLPTNVWDSNSTPPCDHHTNIIPGEGIFDILELPWEIRNIIFKNMNKITSVCAGLTCKVLWRHHRKYHHTVDLLHRSTHRDVGCLPMLLREWMAPERIFRFGHSFYTEKEFQATLYYRQVRKIQIEQIKLITKERKELQAAQDAK